MSTKHPLPGYHTHYVYKTPSAHPDCNITTVPTASTVYIHSHIVAALSTPSLNTKYLIDTYRGDQQQQGQHQLGVHEVQHNEEHS